MDTFVLHQTHRVSASHAIAAQDSFSVCAALSSPDESTTTVAVVNYQHTNLKTKLQMKVCYHLIQCQKAGVGTEGMKLLSSY